MLTSSLFPVLNRGLTFASFHTLGNLPVDMLLLTMYKMLGVMTSAVSLRILGPILSSPVDFLTFKFDKNV